MPTPEADLLEALMDEAKAAARLSPNRSRKTGAVLMTEAGDKSVACNRFPQGVRDLDERHEGEERYRWIEHAERNTIYQAARRGIATEGAMMVTPWYPCDDCARAIAECGIADLYCSEPDFTDPRWGPGFVRAKQILEEGGVAVHYMASARLDEMQAPAPSP